MKDEYALVHQLISLEEEVSDSVRRLNHTVRQYPLRISPERLDDLWKLMLHDMHDPEITIVYHLLKRNCVSPLFESFYKFLGARRSLQDRVVTNYPHFSAPALRFLGLIDEGKTKTPTLNSEFPLPDPQKAACARTLLDTNP